jgi:hypothetical protein
MKKRDKVRQPKYEKAKLKRALYEKARKLKQAAAKRSKDEQ